MSSEIRLDIPHIESIIIAHKIHNFVPYLVLLRCTYCLNTQFFLKVLSYLSIVTYASGFKIFDSVYWFSHNFFIVATLSFDLICLVSLLSNRITVDIILRLFRDIFARSNCLLNVWSVYTCYQAKTNVCIQIFRSPKNFLHIHVFNLES